MTTTEMLLTARFALFTAIVMFFFALTAYRQHRAWRETRRRMDQMRIELETEMNRYLPKCRVIDLSDFRARREQERQSGTVRS